MAFGIDDALAAATAISGLFGGGGGGGSSSADYIKKMRKQVDPTIIPLLLDMIQHPYDTGAEKEAIGQVRKDYARTADLASKALAQQMYERGLGDEGGDITSSGYRRAISGVGARAQQGEMDFLRDLRMQRINRQMQTIGLLSQYLGGAASAMGTAGGLELSAEQLAEQRNQQWLASLGNLAYSLGSSGGGAKTPSAAPALTPAAYNVGATAVAPLPAWTPAPVANPYGAPKVYSPAFGGYAVGG